MEIDLKKYNLKKIKSVVAAGKTHVYDIEVDSPDHAFIAKSSSGAVGISHNSALISLSNLTDDRMRRAKMGQWWINESQRALANNSICYTEKPDMGAFLEEWMALYQSKSGERGIFNRVASVEQIKKSSEFRKNIDESIPCRDWRHPFGTNPCSEIILRPKQFCNLSEVVIRSDDTLESLKEKVRIATILGTLQSSLTNFRYLDEKWKSNSEEECLLGVSLTGIMDNPVMSGQKVDHETLKEFCGGKALKLPTILKILKRVAIETNIEWAKKIGVNVSVATTCIKPSGCCSLDTKVRTSEGDMSMAAIFAMLGPSTNVFECEPGTWIEPEEELFVYDENNDKQRITKLYVNGISEVFEIEDEFGNVYKFTGNHKLKTADGWKRVDELTEDDEIVSFYKEKDMRIKRIEKLQEPLLTVDIEVENTHSYQLSNGMVSHNTVSQLVDSSSGMHDRYSPYYIRTVRADNKDPMTQFLKDQGVPNEPDITKPDSTTVFSFPMKSPENAVMRTDRTAIEQLDMWLLYQTYWCEHKPSITVYVKEDEWMEVGAWVWKNFDKVSGVSFLPFSDHSYQQAPYQEIDEATYKKLMKSFPKIKWEELRNYEFEDNTEGTKTFACTGNACELT